MTHRFFVPVLLVGLAAGALTACNSEAVRVDPAVAAAIGAGCTTVDDCGNEFSCLDEFPGGFCALDCQSSSDCPVGSLCRALDGGAVCVPSCDSDLDCRNGYVCNQVSGSDGATYGLCEPGTSTTDPDAGETDAGGPLDVGGNDAGNPDPSANFGAPCEAVDECSAGDLDPRCLAESQGFPGGSCSAPCEAGAGDCGDGAGCISTSAGGLCMGACDANEDCRDGYRCCASEAGGGLCLPDGLAGRCAPPDEDPNPDPDPADGFTEPPVVGEVGSGCESSSDCEVGEDPYCFDQIPGGLCTSGCETREDCGEGNWCFQGGNGIPNFCVRGCGADAGCNDGQVCCDFSTANVCVFPQLCQ
jgi:hypothetical protein